MVDSILENFTMLFKSLLISQDLRVGFTTKLREGGEIANGNRKMAAV
jgi:hypothetical protein